MTKLTENDVRQWTDVRSFQRGQAYFRQGAILSPRRQGGALKAECMGSMPQPYRVQITLSESGISSGECSCPVGYGGRCKHGVALLLTWCANPDAFTEMDPLVVNLERRSKEDLIALILKILDRYPDVETLLTLEVLSDTPASQRVAALTIKQQVERALYSHGSEWDSGYAISSDVAMIVAIGDSYAERGDWPNATTVYSTVATMLTQNHNSYREEEGEVIGIVQSCVSGLAVCLEMTTDPEERAHILETLVGIYTWDVNFGGIGISDEVPEIILAQTTAAERAAIAQQIRHRLPTGDSWSANYHRQVYGGFLLDLEAEHLTDEDYLRICRETNRIHDLVERLLTLNRLEEAIEATQTASDYDMLRLADQVVAHGHHTTARSLIEARVPHSKDSRLKEWLKVYAYKHNDLETVLTIAMELFWERPAVATYQEVQKAAQPLQRWAEVRAGILEQLALADKDTVLVEIYLEEGDLEQVLQAFDELIQKQQQRERQNPWGWRQANIDNLRLRVARAIEGSHPWRAVELYMFTVQQLINARGRDNYATAAQHLLRVRDIYRAHEDKGGMQKWAEVIATLREQNRRLPALQDELNRAQL